MKLFRISLLLVCVVLLSSCISERGDRDCYGQFTLYFEYHNEENPNPVATFLQHVDYVDVFVFDQTGTLAYYRPNIDQANMQPVARRGGTRSGAPGISLPVGSGIGQLSPGGVYRVVVWGNADRQRNSFQSEGLLNSAHIGTAPDGGTPLHFGPGSLKAENTLPFEITIPRIDYDGSATIEFSRAHIELQVIVIGAEFVPGIEVTDVASGIDFHNELLSGRTSFQSLASTPVHIMWEGVQRPAQKTSFYTPLFNEDTDKEIVVRNGGATLVNGQISLSDALDDHNVVLDDTNVPYMVVPIVIVVGEDAVIDVVILGWERNPVGPDW